MAGTFQVGSIVAELLLEDSAFKRAASSILQRAKTLSSGLKRTLSSASQADIIKERPVLSAISAIGRAVRRLAVTVRTVLGQAFRTALRFSVRAPIAALRTVGRVAARAGRRIRLAFGRGLSRSIQGIRRAVFGLQGALAAVGVGIGAISAVSRAREVESLRAAFESLTGAVGENSDVFLKDLRVATRGAVSDLELFRVTNNAALLGVVQSREQYVELATVARRLGRAVGRDTVDALNDLSVGIGRQSRLILDNLGIIVRVEEANEKYAASLGKTVGEMTDVEKRTAFLNATLDAARQKVGQLGPDVETLADAFGRFTAQISNTATIVAEAFVGPGPFSAIADFLERNQENIRRFATFTARVVRALFKTIGDIVTGFFSASSAKQFGERLSRFVSDVARFALTLISNIIRNLFGELGFLIIKLVIQLGASVANAIVEQIGVAFVRIKAEIQKKIVSLLTDIPFASNILGISSEQVTKTLLSGIETRTRQTIRVLQRASDENQKIIDKAVGQTFESLAGKISEAVDTAKDELKELSGDTAEQGSIIGGALDDAFKEIEDATREFKLIGAVGGRALRDLSAQSQKAAKALQAVSDQFRKTLAPFTQRLRAVELEVKTVGLSDAAKELVKFDEAFKNLKSTLSPEDLTRLDETRKKLSSLLAQRDAAKAIDEVNQKLEELESGGSEASDAVVALERSFQRFAETLTKAGLEASTTSRLLEEMRRSVSALQERAAFADLDETIKGLRESLAETQHELGLINASDLERTIAGINREFELFVDEGTQATQVLLEQRIAAGADADEIEKLRQRLAAFRAEAQLLRDKKISGEIEIAQQEEARRQAEEIAQTLERGLSNAIISAFKRGEGAGKVFANVLAEFFEKAVRDAVNNIVGFLQDALTKLFQSAGAGAGLGGIVTGLLGLAGAILQNLDSQSTSQIDDFSSAINSSEAVRGVVAGPTNVAISKIGDSLKQAMRTTEVLLEQILQTLQRGSVSTGGGGGDLSGNAALPLSTSSAS